MRHSLDRSDNFQISLIRDEGQGPNLKQGRSKRTMQVAGKHNGLCSRINVAMAANGSQWQSMAPNGCQCQPIPANDSPWQPMAAHGSKWQSMHHCFRPAITVVLNVTFLNTNGTFKGPVTSWSKFLLITLWWNVPERMTKTGDFWGPVKGIANGGS